MRTLSIILILASGFGFCEAFHVPKAKALTVDCLSLGNNDDFKHRLKWRQNAEDQTTIWLFKGEQLNIHFELSNDADIAVLDVRYSNDGKTDVIVLTMDGEKLGDFKTHPKTNWGNLWNEFESSGPINGHKFLKAGKHLFGLEIHEADKYGVEIDYVRFNVHGAKLHLSKNDFHCVHNPLFSDADI